MRTFLDNQIFRVMRNLLFTLFAVLLIAACDTSTGEKPFKPFQSANWYVPSPETGEWVGTSGNRKSVAGDTVYLTNPGSQELWAYADTNLTDGFTLTFLDATIHPDSIVETFTTVDSLGNAFVPGPFNNKYWAFRHSYTKNPGYLTFEYELKYSCGTQFDDTNIIFTTYSDSGNTVFRRYIFESEGFADVAETLAQCATP